MASLNRFQAIGNVGKIEPGALPAGDAVVKFSIAINESYKDKQGQKVEKTEWVNCVAFRKLAEIIQQYVTVGQQLYIEGRIHTRKWQDKEGKDRYTTEIVGRDMQMLGGRGGAGSGESSGGGRAAPERSSSNAAPPPSDDGGFDDDIPF